MKKLCVVLAGALEEGRYVTTYFLSQGASLLPLLDFLFHFVFFPYRGAVFIRIISAVWHSLALVAVNSNHCHDNYQ